MNTFISRTNHWVLANKVAFVKQIVLFSMLLMSGMMLTACGGNAPEDVAESFYKAMEKQDVDKVISLIALSDEGTQSKKSKNKEIEYLNHKIPMFAADLSSRIKERGGVKDMSVKSVDMDENKTHAKVIFNITFNNGEQKEEDFKLVKKGSEWKIELK